ncbi:HIRAN domain-containing protein [Microbacteriaceae bacterium VKM Ac-2855]|nr:HIRAN domain-containing protein [Microbacteriaceae bacterium VKM Ac-2855]
MDALLGLIILAVIIWVVIWWRRRKPKTERSTPTPSNRNIVVTTEPSESAESYQSRYLHSSHWDELLAPGKASLRLTKQTDGTFWLTETTTGLLVNVGNRKLAALGIWTVSVRGTSYYEGIAAPGDPVKLVREPNNPYDKNAIAIHHKSGQLGHYNKQMAARMAKLIDAGTKLEAVAIASNKVIAASPSVMARLRSIGPER